MATVGVFDEVATIISGKPITVDFPVAQSEYENLPLSKKLSIAIEEFVSSDSIKFQSVEFPWEDACLRCIIEKNERASVILFMLNPDNGRISVKIPSLEFANLSFVGIKWGDLEDFMRGRTFSTLEDILTAITERIGGLIFGPYIKAASRACILN